MSYSGTRLAFPPLTPAIKLLLIANAVVFLANALLVGRLSAPAEGGGGFWFAFSWSGLFDGYGLGVLRVLSYQFTHSFADPMHFLMNMLVLYFFGTMAEVRLGFAGVWKLYLIGGAVGAVVHLGIAALQGYASVPLVGASGSCYAFLLYAATMSPHSLVIFIIVQVPLWLLAALLVGLGLYTTFVEFATGFGGGVSHGAHLGGAALGFAACRLRWFVDYRSGGLSPARSGFLRGFAERLRARQQAAVATKAADREQELDQILAKVKEKGLSALSAAERRFLERTSAQSRRHS